MEFALHEELNKVIDEANVATDFESPNLFYLSPLNPLQMKPSTCIILFITLLSACVSTKEIMDSFIGKSAHEVVMRLGPPDRTASDENGGKILIYSKSVYVPPRTYYLSDGGSTTKRGEQYYKYSCFYVDSTDTVYHWMVRTYHVPPQQIDLSIFFEN